MQTWTGLRAVSRILCALPLLSRDNPTLSRGCSDQFTLKVGQNALKMSVPCSGEDEVMAGVALHGCAVLCCLPGCGLVAASSLPPLLKCL